MFEIVRYTAEQANEWNQFVATSKNGTFLFDRRYMDYHADRFEDHSLLFYLNSTLYALLPANRQGDTLYSHQGLTYGGLISNEKTTTAHVVQLFRELMAYMKGEGIREMIYKPVPHIYHSIPAEEDLFALYSVCNAQLLERNVKFKEQSRRELAALRRQKMAPLTAILKEAIATVARQQRLVVVLNTDSNACPFIEPEMSMDITQEVLQLLSKQEGEE